MTTAVPPFATLRAPCLLLVLPLAACGGKEGADTSDTSHDSGLDSESGADSESGLDTSDSGDTSDTSDSGDTSDTSDTSDSGDTSDTYQESRDWSTGIVETSAEPGPYAELGYQLSTFEVQEGYAVSFRTPDGLAPQFVVLWPAEPSPGPHPVTLFLHGGSTDVDSEEDPDGAEDRCGRGHGLQQATQILATSPFARLAARAGHVVVAPANTFCDGWAGLGPDDPVDPMHGGEALAEAALGWVLYAQDRVGVDREHVTLGGSSLGGIGLSWTLTRQPELDAVLVDSAVGDMARYCAEEAYSHYDYATRVARCAHVLGGPPWADEAHETPTEWWPRYVEHSLELLVEDGSVRLPIFQSYNDGDPLCPGEANRELTEAVSTAYDATGVRWSALDVDHDEPIHGQITDPSVYYVGEGARRFAEGQAVWWLEAEDAEGFLVGDRYEAAFEDPYFSKAAGRQATRAAGAGTLWQSELPAPAGELVAWIRARDPSADDAVVGRLVVEDGGAEIASVELLGGDLAYEDPTAWDERTRAMDAATLAYAGSAPTARLEVTGAANVAVDLVMVASP